MLLVFLSALVICIVLGNEVPSAHDADENGIAIDVADGDSFAVSNRSFFGSRQLKSSIDCRSCCGGGPCDAAFKGVEPGICCLRDPDRPYCCPATARCSQVSGHCIRSSKVQQTTKHSAGWHRHREAAYHSGNLRAFVSLVLMIIIFGCLLACYHFFVKAETAAKPVMVLGQPGMGPGGSPVVYGQPVASQSVVGNNAALYGGTGFLGGLALGSMMMGPGFGWGGGYGHGYGYGPEAMTSETTMTDFRSEEFVGDGGGFDDGFGGGFGGELGALDIGGGFGDFGGDF